MKTAYDSAILSNHPLTNNDRMAIAQFIAERLKVRHDDEVAIVLVVDTGTTHEDLDLGRDSLRKLYPNLPNQRIREAARG